MFFWGYYRELGWMYCEAWTLFGEESHISATLPTILMTN